MTADELATIGERLYGADWRHPLARALFVDYRTLRRWCTGDSPIPAGVVENARQLLQIALSAERMKATHVKRSGTTRPAAAPADGTNRPTGRHKPGRN